MAVRPIDRSSSAVIVPFTVKASSVATKGKGAIFGAGDTDAEDAGANGKVSAIFLESGVAGDVVDAAVDGVVPVLVGTGGATAGEFAIATADGFTDQTLGGGTGVKYIAGKFLQSGVAGDYVGMKIGFFAGGA